LNSNQKYFLHTTKNRLSHPSEISALEFKGEFCRYRICSVSAIIGIHQSIFLNSSIALGHVSREKYLQFGNLQPGRLQTSKEVDHCGVDLWGAFLLGPMTTARQHYRGPELGDQCRLLRDVLGENGGDKIALARHVQRGNGHRRFGEGSHQLPAAIDVTPPGEGTMESAPHVFLDVNVDI
jgi:hypothetical protein